MLDLPVIGVGGITEPEYADKIILERKVDLVAVGGDLLKDADWARKANERLIADWQPEERRSPKQDKS